MPEKIDKRETQIVNCLNGLGKVLLISMLILNLDSFLLYVFSLILNNLLIYASILFSSINVIFNWRVVRNPEHFSKREPQENINNLNKLLIYSLAILVITVVALVYTFLFRIYLGKDDFKQLYFEEDVVLYYRLYICLFTLYSLINLVLPILTINDLIKLRKLLNSQIIEYSESSMKSFDQSAVKEVEVLELTLSSNKGDL